MAIETRPLAFRHDETEFEGLLVADAEAGPRPLVLVFHTIAGRGENELAAAERLARRGYSALVCDLYGRDYIGKPREECAVLMRALLADRPRLQDRMLRLLDFARTQTEVDAERVAAIGFCFGGLCALDLARTGAHIRGAASFHGILTPPGNLDGRAIRAKVIVFHGWDDPMAPPDHVEALGRELSSGGADWQVHAYGGTVHGFTNPNAADPERGVVYNPVAADRSWRALDGFLEECFEPRG
jgi:dienelactone hydrolase